MNSILDIVGGIPPGKAAICAPGRRELNGHDLRSAIADFRAAVPGGLDDRRVAIVGPDTAETAVVLLAVAATATAAPLNPQLTESEFAFEYRDLGIDLVLLHASAPAPAMTAAIQVGLSVARYDDDAEAPAGIANIIETVAQVRSGVSHRRQGIAFVLHTSGTTSQPKIVPLLEDRIAISADNIARRLCLTDNDRTLCIMPLFHVHGILTVLLPSLVSGASVSFAGVFDSTRAFEWLTRSRATWLSAVPAMHNAMLARAKAEARTGFSGLRFVRSSSAALPMQTRAALEKFYGVPVIESYGMTEIEQIASQELPPAKRKAGSVGRSGGPHIRILVGGRDAPLGSVGEVCVSGPNCFPRYENNASATRAAFIGNFFKTGDLGRLDEDGHLFLVGRAKDIIVRGGEKIAPSEIEEAVSDYPGIVEAAAFAIPDEILGEDIAIAVVARDPVPGFVELIDHAARRLAPFKLPKKIMVLDSLPRGPTGKLQRRMLGEIFAGKHAAANGANASRNAPPQNALEKIVTEIWSEVLDISPIGRQTTFSSLGGSSDGAAKVLTKLERRLNRTIPLGLILKAETVEDIAEALSAA